MDWTALLYLLFGLDVNKLDFAEKCDCSSRHAVTVPTLVVHEVLAWVGGY